MATLIASGDAVPDDGPNGSLTRVRVLWYDDGSMRMRVYRTPLGITEAYLQGGKNDHSILRLTPVDDGKAWADPDPKAERTPLRQTCVVDPEHFTFGYYRIMAGERIEAYVCQQHIPDLSEDERARLVIVTEAQAKKEAGIW